MVLVLACLPVSQLKAQGGGDLGGDTIIVVQDKIPIVEDANKLTYQGQEKDYNKAPSQLNYTVPDKVLSVNYQPINISPLAISREKPQKYPGSYVKLGFGTQLSPLVEARYTGRVLKGYEERMNYGAYFKHFSGYGRKIDNQDFSQNHVGLFANALFKRVRLSSDFHFSRDAVFYYGYDHADTSFKKSAVRQHFNYSDLSLAITRGNLGKYHFDYEAKINLYYLKDNFKQQESDINAIVNFKKVFKEKHFITLDFSEDYSLFQNGLMTQNRNLFIVKPGYEYNDQVWKIFAKGSFIWEGNVFQVLPDFGTERSLYKEYIVLYSGWKWELRKLGYRELKDANPWIEPQDFYLRNTSFEDRYGGLKGNIKKFSYDLRMCQNVVRRAVLFVNDSTDMSKFNVIYNSKRLNIINPHAEFGLRINTDLEFMLTGDYYMYEAQGEEKAWHMPTWKVNFFTRFTVANKVFIQFNMYALDGVYAKLPGDTIKKLKGTFDLNIGATYKLSDHFSFFANLNNLASFKYQRYYLYPDYGFNAMAGVIFTLD